MSREEKLLWVIALILGVMWCGGSVLAAVPRTISYQGYLKDSAGKPITAATSLTFRLYSTTSGVNPVWSESRSVTPVNGVYAVGLGETSPLPIPFNRQYYLGVQAGVDPELRPLQMLMAAPYALHAGCNPGDMLNCYTGPPETMNVGLCKSGVRSCASDGNGFGACIGEFAPNCGGICLDLSSNAANCGTCGNACPTVSNGTPRCSGGVCGYTCTVGWGDCDTNSANGCETNLSNNQNNCGSCGTTCSGGNACSIPICLNNACTLAFLAYGTVIATQTPGDCHTNKCDGSGQIVSYVDDTDLPTATGQCVHAMCSNGVPMMPNIANGTPCNDGNPATVGDVCFNGICMPGI